MQSKMQRLHLSSFWQLRKLKNMQNFILHIIVMLISIAIIATNAILGGLIIIAFLFLYLIPILIKQIEEFKNNIDNK